MGGLLGGGGSSKPAPFKNWLLRLAWRARCPTLGRSRCEPQCRRISGVVWCRTTNFPNQQQMTADQLAFGGYGSSPDILG